MRDFTIYKSNKGIGEIMILKETIMYKWQGKENPCCENEGEKKYKDWIQMIANRDEERAKQLKGKHVHKLGNLTLTAYNPNLSNSTFIKKRGRKDEKSNHIGHKNRFYLNKSLANKNRWTVADIEERTEELVKEDFELFTVEREKAGNINFKCLNGNG